MNERFFSIIVSWNLSDRFVHALCLPDLLILFKEFETSKNLEKIVKHKIDGRYHCPPFSSAFKEGRIVNEDDNYVSTPAARQLRVMHRASGPMLTLCV